MEGRLWLEEAAWGPRGPLTPSAAPSAPTRFWFRLYWFPLKVLYATCHSSLQTVPNIPFYFFFNALLLVLTLMNIYWFLVSRGSSATLRWLLPPQLRLRNAGCLPGPGYLGGCRAGEAQGFGGEERREACVSARGAVLC